jgi:acetamidase/formamidase
MADQERDVSFESIKSRFLDGKLSREEFLRKATDLGQGAAAYAWIDAPEPLCTPGTTSAGDAIPVASDAEIGRLAERAELITFAPRPEQFAWTFGGVPPVLQVRPGQLLKLWSEDAFAGNIMTKGDLPSKVLRYPFVNPQTGPFYVEGAEVGDTLAIHFVDIQPAADQGISTTIPLFGGLTATYYTQLLNPALPEVVWVYRVSRERRTVGYEANDSPYTVEIPLEPFLGTVGVAPRAMEARNVLVPEAFGGNMDTPEARAGTTVYLGVNVPGALFSIGDGHYAQSEGELCGVAVEGRMHTTLLVDVIKNAYVDWPRLENDEFVMTAGSYRPLEDAYRIAFTQMVRWVSADSGLSTMDAYQLVSQVARTHVANVVDPNYTIIAKVPKRYLKPGGTVMNGTHKKLRALARALGDRARAAA